MQGPPPWLKAMYHEALATPPAIQVVPVGRGFSTSIGVRVRVRVRSEEIRMLLQETIGIRVRGGGLLPEFTLHLS